MHATGGAVRGGRQRLVHGKLLGVRTLADDLDDDGGNEGPVARRRAITETRAVLRQGSAAWAPYSCPAAGECCQLATTKRPPWLWPSEWWLLEEALKAARRPLPPARADGGCPFLDASGVRCSVYEARPLGCRTFFCGRIAGPSKLPGDVTNRLLERLEALNLQVNPQAAPRSLPDWHQGASR